jgi:DNA-binding ferritin-like protein
MLHAAFEEQYEALAEGVDVLAERIRALQEYTPGNFHEIARIKMSKDVPDA